MQIFLVDFVCFLFGCCINIYYSFFLGFKGGKFYYQVYQCGVKLIGVMVYFVIGDLDEGLIIEQDVEWISYFDMFDDLVCKGCDIECWVFVWVVCWYLEDWVLMNDVKIVVFWD